MNKQELIAELERLEVDRAKMMVIVFYGFAAEYGMKPPEDVNEIMAWMIWGAKRKAEMVFKADTAVKAGKSAYDAAAEFQRIYELSLHGYYPAPQSQIKGAKK